MNVEWTNFIFYVFDYKYCTLFDMLSALCSCVADCKKVWILHLITLNPTKEGIRLGYSLNVGYGRSYGIELCNESTAASTTDFSYPSPSSSYFAGRILFDNI